MCLVEFALSFEDVPETQMADAQSGQLADLLLELWHPQIPVFNMWRMYESGGEYLSNGVLHQSAYRRTLYSEEI